jgi:hypothetical protein
MDFISKDFTLSAMLVENIELRFEVQGCMCELGISRFCWSFARIAEKRWLSYAAGLARISGSTKDP